MSAPAGVSSGYGIDRKAMKGAWIIGRQPEPQAIRERLAGRPIIWIGGSPCAGKSTIAARLAAAHGCALYRCDEALDGHLRRVTPVGQPLMSGLASKSWNEIWMRPVEVQIREELAFYREEFPLILDDLLALPAATPLIIEGTAVLPELVAPLLPTPRSAVWLVPRADFQREHYARRPWIADILAQCDDPPLAFDNWMRRDSGFADIVEAQATERALWIRRIDGTVSIEAMTTLVATWLGLQEPRVVGGPSRGR